MIPPLKIGFAQPLQNLRSPADDEGTIVPLLNPKQQLQQIAFARLMQCCYPMPLALRLKPEMLWKFNHSLPASASSSWLSEKQPTAHSPGSERARYHSPSCRSRLPSCRLPVPSCGLPGGSVRGERANFTRLVLGCIEAKFCK